MHPALQNTFILHHILDQWDAQEVKTGCYNTALVCRAFYNPSQDMLWRRLDSVLPLFKLLSNFSRDEIGDVWVMVGDVSPSELQILQAFGRRVRELDIDTWGYKIDPSVYILISGALGASPLFSNIQTLSYLPDDWCNENAHYGAALNLFFSPSLRNVRMAPMTAQQHHNYATFALRLSLAPQLSLLHLINFSPCQKGLDGILSLKHLCDVVLDLVDSPKAVNRTMFRSLGALEHLSSLTMTLPDVDWTSSDTVTMQSIVFSKLIRLVLHSSIHDVTQFLTETKLPALQKLVYLFPIPGSPLSLCFLLKEFIDRLRISTTSQFSALLLRPSPIPRQIRMSGETLLWVFMEEYLAVPFRYLADGLFRLNLSSLQLCFPLFESLCVADFIATGNAWPNMTRLRLHPKSLRAPIPDTTVLRMIAAGFPRLSVLVIDMNAEHIDEPLLETSSHPLQILTARLAGGPKTNREMLRFAALLDSLFPMLCTVSSVSIGVVDNPTCQVQDIIEELQSSRKRERNRIRSESDIKQANDGIQIAVMSCDEEDFSLIV
ncbi:hypothetical protein CVT24_000985 [Panaeolus cyanescens]|uniref:F-box domain-containing protein n=1 Tax=Panaeolus cyanescens TaxID=181874 RepID=A0A409YCF5_9AGAR|nr:hypothetical protein CVT24_000985 [Panaeolus cyanescens]